MNLSELAGMLGISQTTASRALAGYPDVSAATRIRVQEAAREHGYFPNPTARRLQKGKTETVGLVLPTGPGQFGDPFFVEMLASIGEALARVGYDLVVMAASSEDGGELAAYRRLVEGQRVDGLIVGRSRRRDERIRYLLDRGFPFVVHGRTEDPRPYAYVDVDAEKAFRLATERLIGLGHRRIALINQPAELMSGTHRLAGYRAGLAAAGLSVDDALVAWGDMSEDSGFELTYRLMARAPQPSAILCATDRMAVGCLRALQRQGLTPGRDVSVIGYDDLPLARFTDPPLTTMHQPIREAGQRLVEMLMEIIAGQPLEGLQEIWEATLVARGSDGPPVTEHVNKGGSDAMVRNLPRR